ncbi:MAG: integrase core domain-containing protein [Thaumarchaeota archaeon]|nr:integrase core domain-containing protein [Nitrososphaerota archaeon]
MAYSISQMILESMKSLGIQQEFIWNNTPQQNRHIESFHGRIKIEYIWPHDFTRFQDAQSVLKKAPSYTIIATGYLSLGYIILHEISAIGGRA